jgi:hypothetical protein
LKDGNGASIAKAFLLFIEQVKVLLGELLPECLYVLASSKDEIAADAIGSDFYGVIYWFVVGWIEGSCDLL